METLSRIEAAPPARSTSSRLTRALAIVFIALAGASIFAARIKPADMDYISYWSAATLFVHHGGPYSPTGVFALEKSAGFPAHGPLMMRNPPWALFLVAPLGFLDPRIGQGLWIITLAACIILSVHLLNPRLKDNALALLFAPAIACFGSGQTSPFLLLGFALFLCFHQHRPFLAGAALLLMANKPHLFLVFWAVLLAESLYRRRFRILAGFAVALALATAFAMAIDSHVWPQYLSTMRASALELETFPTASEIFRLLIHPAAAWLLFVPSALAVLWGLWYYSQNRQQWNWASHGMLLMLVTVMASPYDWFTDEVVLLPSLIFALNLPQKRRYSVWLLLAINLAAFAVTRIGADGSGFALESPFLIWTPAAWFVWFLYATHRSRLRSRDALTSLANQEAH